MNWQAKSSLKTMEAAGIYMMPYGHGRVIRMVAEKLKIVANINGGVWKPIARRHRFTMWPQSSRVSSKSGNIGVMWLGCRSALPRIVGPGQETMPQVPRC